jgi:ligand-binding SRPBCC domain-containing protein
MYLLQKKQTVNTDLDKAWAFISSPRNLNLITPNDLHFEILSDVPDTMHEGLIIDYHVTIPVIGRTYWVSELKHIVPKCSFVDEQRMGPYKFWYHYHEIRKNALGVTFVDKVYYLPPWGLLGTLMHKVFIKKTLDRIFAFRQEALCKILEAENLSVNSG